MPKLEEQAHQLATMALEQQERSLTELRGRTGTLLTASSLVGSFLGGQALARSGLSVWVVLALLAFVLSVAMCIYVLLPKNGLVFAFSGPSTYEALREVNEDEQEISRRLALWVEANREANQPTVDHLTKVFEIAGLVMLVKIAWLGIGLALG